MRTVFCSCGVRLYGADDEALFREYCKHVNVAHPNKRIRNANISAVIKANAYDVPEPQRDVDTIATLEHGSQSGSPQRQHLNQLSVGGKE